MATSEEIIQTSPVEALRKQILTLSYEDIQRLKFNLPPRPPAREVTIKVERDSQSPKGRVLRVKQETDKIAPHEQLVWTCPDGFLEIRLSRAQSPFAGDLYQVARGGKVFSGTPVKRVKTPKTFIYTFLVTTPDGYFLTLDWPITVIPPASQTKRAATPSKAKK